MRNRRQNHAVDRAQLARRAKPLGELVVQTARAKQVGGVPPAPVVKPEPKRRKRAKKQDREAPVLHDCLRWLKKQGIFAWRNNSGTLWTSGQPVSFGYSGSSDILGILPTGQMLAVECKSPTGRQSAKQKKFEEKIKASNGVYLLVRSVEELERGLSE
jgi:hypothetical protein